MCIGGGVGEGGRYSVHRGQKEESDALELEGQVVVSLLSVLEVDLGD